MREGLLEIPGVAPGMARLEDVIKGEVAVVSAGVAVTTSIVVGASVQNNAAMLSSV